MPTRERRVDRGTRQAGVLLRTAATELRDARIAAGVSQGLVAAAAGLSRAELSRIERAAAPWMAVSTLCRLAAVVGLQPSLRLYPVASPLRDQAHRDLLERLRTHLAAGLTWRTEVPLPIAGDLRAWDAVISGPTWRVAVEAETRLRDARALARKIELKRRDAGIETVILLVANTRNNRYILETSGSSLIESFPLAGRHVLAALESGRRPEASGIVRA